MAKRGEPTDRVWRSFRGKQPRLAAMRSAADGGGSQRESMRYKRPLKTLPLEAEIRDRSKRSRRR